MFGIESGMLPTATGSNAVHGRLAGNRSKASCASHTSTTIQLPLGVEPAVWLMTPPGHSGMRSEADAMVRFPRSHPS
jgi:hypothetical protein